MLAFTSNGFSNLGGTDAIVYHKNALSMPMHSHKKYYFNHRNSLLMLFGNYSFKNTLILGFAKRTILELVALGYSTLSLNWKHAFAIIRSFYIYFFHVDIIFKRRKMKAIRTKGDSDIMKNILKNSIVINYYLKGVRLYSEIDSIDS